MMPLIPSQTLEKMVLIPSQTPCQSPDRADVQTWIMPDMTPTTVETTLDRISHTPVNTVLMPSQMVDQFAATPVKMLTMRSATGCP